MNHRRGMTLIEMMVVISTMAVVMALSGATVFYLMRAEGNGATALTASTSFARLQNTFRRDIHAATSARINERDNGTEFLELRIGQSQSVEYRVVGDRIVRYLVVGQSAKSIEEYNVPKTTVRFEVLGEGRDSIAVIRCDRQPFLGQETKLKDIPKREFRIEASVARDWRFEKVSQQN